MNIRLCPLSVRTRQALTAAPTVGHGRRPYVPSDPAESDHLASYPVGSPAPAGYCGPSVRPACGCRNRGIRTWAGITLLPDWFPGTQRAGSGSDTISSRDFPPAYLIFARLCGWLAVLPRFVHVKNAELLVLRHQIAVLQRQVRSPQPSRADRQSWPLSPSCCLPRTAASCG